MKRENGIQPPCRAISERNKSIRRALWRKASSDGVGNAAGLNALEERDGISLNVQFLPSMVGAKNT